MPAPARLSIVLLIFALLAPSACHGKRYAPSLAQAAPAQRTSNAARPAARSDLQAKIERVRQGVQEWKAKGQDPKPIFLLMKDVEKLLKQGRAEEANRRVDRALAMVAPGGAAATAPSGAAGVPRSAPVARATPAIGKVGAGGWRLVGDTPVLDLLSPPTGLSGSIARAPLQNWNDPSVLREAGGYSMWASLGMQGGGRNVSIYKLTSSDGIQWQLANRGEPVLRPGSRSEFDWYGVETPAVIRVGSTYHMYYTAYHNPDPRRGGHEYTMGHATSPDGIRWTKQGELRSLTDVVGKRSHNPWGWLARAEPAVTYYKGTFYLYFSDAHCRHSDCKGSSPAVRGISLATSTDGQDFVQVGNTPVLLQTASYPSSEGWDGYSTPWVYHDGTWFQLYVDVFRKVDWGYAQTRIAHYRSRDGSHFEEVQTDIVRVEGNPWATMSVRAPTVVEVNGERKMWYAGDNFDPRHKGRDIAADLRSGKLRMGIGMAVAPR